jgi:hypothetical protein
MASTVQFITIMIVMLAINVALTMVQGGITEVNPYGSYNFNITNSPYANYAANGTLLVDDSYLPADESVEGDTSGNVFSDTYKTMKGWTQKAMAPLKFAVDIFKQPYGFLKDIGLNNSIALPIAVFWYIIAIILFVSWLAGR